MNLLTLIRALSRSLLLRYLVVTTIVVCGFHHHRLFADDFTDTDSCPDNPSDTDLTDDPTDDDTDSGEDFDPSDTDVTDLDVSDVDVDVTDIPPDIVDTPPDDTDTPPDITDITDTPPDNTDVTDTPPDNTDIPPDITDTPPDNTDTPPDITDTPPDNTDTPPDNTDVPPDNIDTTTDTTDAPPDTSTDTTDSTTDTTDGSSDTTDTDTSSDTTDTTTDSDTGDVDLDSSGDTDGGYEEGANPFRPHDGNVTRKVRDLRIFGSTQNRLTWARYHNTRPRKQDGATFGGAGDWRHNWQYTLFEMPSSTDATRSQFDLVYPSGLRRDFRPVSGGGWAASPAYREKIAAVADGFDVATSRNDMLHFVRKQDVNGTRYEMQQLTDRFGRVTKLTYDDSGRLQSVVDPSGRSLSLAYKKIPFQHTIRIELGVLGNGTGWQEIAVPTGQRDQAFDTIRVRLPDGSSAGIAEVEVLGADSAKPFNGKAKGSTTSAAAAFDGNTATAFTGANGTVSWCQLDFGRGKGNKIARIRVLGTGSPDGLNGAVVEGLYTRPDFAVVLDKVQGSDGRATTYDYTMVGGAVALTGTRYGDGATAQYTYSSAIVATRPLLVDADDPHFVGRAKHIRYDYRKDSYTNRGMVHQEINPATGSVYVSLETDPADPLKRVVHYSDLRQIVYQLSPLGEGRVASRTDSLGRTTTISYDAQGRKATKTMPTGITYAFSYDSNNRLVRLERNGKTEVEYERDGRGFITKKTNRLGRVTAFNRNETGRVTKILYPDGTGREFAYDQAGHVTSYKNRLGDSYQITYNQRGLKTAVSGSRGYAKSYAYDGFDRRSAVTDSVGRTTDFERNDRGQLTKIVYADGRTRQAAFDGYGRAVSRTNRLGRTTKYTRDGLGRVTRREDYKGDVTTYEYAELPGSCGCKTFSGQPTAITGPNGLTTAFLYDSEGRMLARTIAVGTKDSATTLREYDTSNNLVSKTDPLGHVTKFTYDDRNHRVSEIDPLGRETKFAYSERGRVTAITKPGNLVTRFTYDSNGRLVVKTDPDGNATSYQRDSQGRVVGLTDRLGNTTKFSYEGRRRTAIVFADGSTYTRRYDAAGRVVSATNRDGLVTTFTRDAGNRILTKSDSLGRNFSYSYDNFGRRLTVTDPIGRVSRWTYDDRGYLVGRTTRTGTVHRYERDTKGHHTAITNALGQKTSFTYNAAGKLASITDAKGKTRSIGYDERLRRTAVTYSDGKSRTWVWDAANRLASVGTPDGLTVQLGYDDANRLVSTSDSLGRKTSRTYSVNNRLLSATDPLGGVRRWNYDSFGRLASKSTPDGATAKFEYNDKGQRTASIDARDSVTRFAYDQNGRLASRTDPKGNAYSFTRDVRGRKTKMGYPDGSEERWSYDAGGRITSRSMRAGQVQTTVYNAANQRAQQTWSPAGVAPDVAYGYNNAGRLATLDNGQVKLTYVYDSIGRLVSETTDISAVLSGQAPQTVTYSYDEAGRRSEIGYPSGGKIVRSYDDRGRLAAVGDGSGRIYAAYAYDAGGRIGTMTRDNGAVTTYTYDAASRLTDLVHAKGTQILAASHYALDAMGRRIAQTREDGHSERYAYDTSGQLTSVDYGSGTSESFTYDAIGNRVEAGYVVANGSPRLDRYAANALNQYTAIGGIAYSYDANGNLSNDGERKYRYDAGNRLVGVEDLRAISDSVRADFFYDARDRCTARVYYKNNGQGQWSLDPASTRVLSYDNNWNLLSERAFDGVQTGEYVHGARIDEIIVSASTISHPTRIAYSLTDALGSTMALVDADSAVTSRVRYEAFGKPRFLDSDYKPTSNSGSGFRFLFSGREWLDQFGLVDHRNRYLKQDAGRWTSVDPIKFEAGDGNLYRYVNNSAPNLSDPSGLLQCPWPCHKGEVSSVGPERFSGYNNCDSYTISTNYSETVTGSLGVKGATVSYSKTVSGTIPPRKKIAIYVKASCTCTGWFWGGCSADVYVVESSCP